MHNKMTPLLFTFLACLLSACTCLASTSSSSNHHHPPGGSRRQSSSPGSGEGGADVGGGGGDLDHFAYPAWSVLNFDGACSPGGCLLSFNLSSAATASAPAIRAACDDVNGDVPDWQPCTTLAGIDFLFSSSSSSSWRRSSSSDQDDSRIWARPLPALHSFAVSIQHRFSNASLTPTRYYNITGNMTIDYEKVKLPANLTVAGTRVSESWSWTISKTVER